MSRSKVKATLPRWKPGERATRYHEGAGQRHALILGVFLLDLDMRKMRVHSSGTAFTNTSCRNSSHWKNSPKSSSHTAAQWTKRSDYILFFYICIPLISSSWNNWS